MKLKTSITAPLLALQATLAFSQADSITHTTEGFSIPQAGRVFEFPRDHGSHPDFKIEWWYITGHLFAGEGQRFGFQATFFRQGNRLEGEETTSFQHRQLHLAHMAVLDAKTGRFLHQERMNRAGWDADSSTKSLDLRNGNWTLKMTDPATNRMQLVGGITGEVKFDLELTPSKPLVFFGKDGISKKGDQASAVSHYLTFPRIAARGQVQVGTTAHAVTGEAWMDHEISSSQLTPEQAGWDWAAIQLKDGRDIMVYRMRRKDGGLDPYSTMAWIDAKGQVTHLAHDQFVWSVQGEWTSPTTKTRYPIRPRITGRDPVSGETVTFNLEPLAEAQEQTGSLGGTSYWEGACRVLDAKGNEVGSAFLELAGYKGDLAEQFR